TRADPLRAGGQGRPPGDLGRPLRRDEGSARRVLGAGLREPGAGHGDRGARRPVPGPGGLARPPGRHPPHSGERRRSVPVTGTSEVEDLLRLHAPQVLGALVRRYGHFGPAEDSVQEALLAAAQQWPRTGVPDNPRGWLIKVASRRLTDQLRSD